MCGVKSGLGKVGRHLQIDLLHLAFSKPENNAKSSALQKNNDTWHVQ
jgi:hypothetical protein